MAGKFDQEFGGWRISRGLGFRAILVVLSFLCVDDVGGGIPVSGSCAFGRAACRARSLVIER